MLRRSRMPPTAEGSAASADCVPSACVDTPSAKAGTTGVGGEPMPSSASRITKTPGLCGGDACVEGHRIPVWVLEGYHRLGSSDADILSYYPQLTEADLAAAWEYARAHPDEIDQAIVENE